jgi:transposase
MERVDERWCGLDVHEGSVTACVRVPKRQGGRGELIESFTTMTADLLARRDWLRGLGVTHVAMEATGVYWKPVWYLLEDDLELLLCNPGQVKNVSGRKTDVSDAQWLCQLLEHGLLRSGFVPPKPIRELRDLTRYRKTLTKERQREANRLHNVLEDAGIKLAGVAADVPGVSGRAMIDALVAGEGDPSVPARAGPRAPARETARAATRARGALLSSPRAALLAHTRPPRLPRRGGRVAQRGDRQADPPPSPVSWNCSTRSPPSASAQPNRSWPSSAPTSAASPPIATARWARLSPGNDESADKRRPGKTGPGNPWLREILIERARAAARNSDTHPKAQYPHLRRRRGDRKALVAVAHSILVSTHHILENRQPHRDLGLDHFQPREQPDQIVRRLTRQLEQLGHRVTLEPLAA